MMWSCVFALIFSGDRHSMPMSRRIAEIVSIINGLEHKYWGMVNRCLQEGTESANQYNV